MRKHTSERAEHHSRVTYIHTVDTCTLFDQSHSHGHASRVGRVYIEHHGGRLVYREYNHAARETRRETKAVARVTLIDSPTSGRGHFFRIVSPRFIPIISSLFIVSLSCYWDLSLTPSPPLAGQLLSLSVIFYLCLSVSLRSHDIHFPPDASTTVLRDSVDFETVHTPATRNFSDV